MRKHSRVLIAVALLVGLGAMTASAGMTGEYYLTRWWVRNTPGIQVVHGSAIARQWMPVNTLETGIAVSGTVRTIAEVLLNGDGHEYTASGTYTGVSFANGATFAGDATNVYFGDGTTDGQHNYAVDYATGGVFQYDFNWANPVRLFYAPTNLIGITYDPTSNSLWFSSDNDNHITNYSMDGVHLGSFGTSHSENAALALDYSDGTLWFQNYATGDLEQWSKGGTLLSTVAHSDVGGSWYSGGEFDYMIIPAPAAVVLGALGASLVTSLRRRLS